MSDQMIGSQSPAKKVSWLKRDVLLFNVSIGCTEPQFLYERHKDFAAFPTYPLALVFKQSNQEVIDFYSAQDSPVLPGGLRLDTKHLVDGQRAIEVLKPLPVTSEGRDFEFRSKVL
ncbi:enoyl- hydratase 2, partial [Fusarium albosuccineum]